VPAPRFAAAGWSDFKAQRCLEVSSIHRNAGLGFLRVTNEHKRQTHQRKYESRHCQMIVAFKSAALALFGSEMSSRKEDLRKRTDNCGSGSANTKLARNRLRGHVPQQYLPNSVMDQKR